jgi:hypothetical protein
MRFSFVSHHQVMIGEVILDMFDSLRRAENTQGP